MFTVGFSFAFYLLAATALIPALRFVTRPLHRLPAPVGAAIALVIGGALGVLVLALVTSSEIGAFMTTTKAAIKQDPALAIGVLVSSSLGPTTLGLLLGRRRE